MKKSSIERVRVRETDPGMVNTIYTYMRITIIKLKKMNYTRKH